jgi:hypothetical protein
MSSLPRSLDRRSAIRMLGALGLGVASRGALPAGVGAGYTQTTEIVPAPWLSYVDAGGHELARIRLITLMQITGNPGVDTTAGQRSLELRLSIWNTGAASLIVPPEWFALWSADGTFYRPRDVYVASPPRLDMEEHRRHQYSAEPIPWAARRFGWLTYGVPEEATVTGILFTSAPERVLVLADFSHPLSVIWD